VTPLSPEQRARREIDSRISPIGEAQSNWLHVFFESSGYWQIRESSAGIDQPNVNGSKLQALRVPLPPLSEQHRIVTEVERLLSITDGIESTVKACA
jgi:type I restriction enzyme S subunit